MFKRAKDHWQHFKHSEPGRRFQDRYDRHQQTTLGRWSLGKVFNIVGGIAIAIVGVILLPAPGPGTLIIFAGLGLLGSEFLPIARALDWAELRLRALTLRAKAIWAGFSLLVKMLICLIILSGMAAMGYASFFICCGGAKA